MKNQKLNTICACLCMASSTTMASDCGTINLHIQNAFPKYGSVREILYDQLKAAVVPENGGFNNNVWLVIVDETGGVCHVMNSGAENAFVYPDLRESWITGRVDAATKAFSANGFSVSSDAKQSGHNIAFSSANLYQATQPGGPLFGIQFSNPANFTMTQADGFTHYFGTSQDPMMGLIPGGISVTGGGVALYPDNGLKEGGLGISGDTTCTDHIVAWKIRYAIKLDYIPGGPAAGATPGQTTDNMTFSGPYRHPSCSTKEKNVIKQLPKSYPIR